jgi:Na+-translocating ferredoxin:NAD+ oxidoreductase RnfC subunit
MSQSIADQFIDTMAALRAITPENDEPMRHSIRMIKHEAEMIIEEALRRAYAMSYQARAIQKDAADAIKEAVSAAAPSPAKESK